MNWEGNIDNMLLSLKTDLDNTKDQLNMKLDWVIRTLERAKEELNSEKPILNSLGILQASGVDIDRLVGIYCKQQELYKTMEYRAERIKESVLKELKDQEIKETLKHATQI